MFDKLNKNLENLQYFFEYTEIDPASLEVLKHLPLIEKYYRNAVPSRWCINLERQIAFLQEEYVPSAIVRGNADECFYRFLFFQREAWGCIEFYYSEWQDEILMPKIAYAESRKNAVIPRNQLLMLVQEAMKAYKKAKSVEYETDYLMHEIKRLKKTYYALIHGAFSDMLLELVNSVTEVSNMNIKFRKICLNHFTECNLSPPKVHGFYLYDDEKSFAVYDVIVWMYLHKYTSLTRLRQEWYRISNADIYYKSPETVFVIGGDKKFFCECYLHDRIQKKILCTEQDSITMSQEVSQKILAMLNQML